LTIIVNEEMKNQTLKLPFYVILSFTLISIILIFVLLYFGKPILIPLIIALLLAILLNPILYILENKFHLSRFLAVVLSVLLFVAALLAVALFIVWQISDLTKDMDKIQSNLGIYADKIRFWIRDTIGYSIHEQQGFLSTTSGKILNGGSAIMTSSFGILSNSLLNMVLVPVYMFLFLLYKELFIHFLYKLVKVPYQSILKDILTQVNYILKRYIVGLLLQMLVVGILTYIGLIILGVKYAILLSIITALLNLIPYIGIMMAVVTAILATLIHSSEPFIVIGVMVLYIVVQIIDNNFLVPRIVGNKVKINALASIVGVITGGVVAGIAGMFLAIPLLAIVKVVFDRIETLKPWGYLLGDKKETQS
jgi:predicted PurR-regulated permease PerM